jgi:tetratricopeptide (TPR) repeat protein
MSGRALGLLLLLLVAAAGAGAWWWRGSDSGGRGGRGHLTVEQRLDLQQHLLQGVELLRNFEIERALAELDAALAIDPGNVEAWFHEARALAVRDGAAAAEAKLAKVDALDPRHAPSALLRLSIHANASDPAAAAKREAARARAESSYPGLFEIDEKLAAEYRQDSLQPLLGFDSLATLLEGVRTTPLVAKAQAATVALAEKLDSVSDGKWNELLDGTPGLTALRLHYGAILYRGRLRFREIPLADKPQAYSGFTLEVAAKHYAKVMDQSALDSRACWVALYALGDIGMRMGDWRGAADKLGLLLKQKGLPDSWRQRTTLLLGTVLYKDQRFEKAAAVLEPYVKETRDPVGGWLLHLMDKVRFQLRDENVGAENRRLLKFTEMAGELGIAKIAGAGPSAWGDVDGDGDLDLFVTGCDTFSSLYRNDGGRYSEITREAGLFNVSSGFSATLVDVDNDGDLDLYVGRNGWAGPGPNSLYLNDGKANFTDVTATSGVECPVATFVHSWADFDRDGRIDLFCCNGISDHSNNRLYLNQGGGRFRDATRELGLEEPIGTRTIGCAIGDYDKDGWPDLFLGGFDVESRLYRNLGGKRFEEVAKRAGIAVEGDLKNHFVSFMFDYDNDGWLDLLAVKQAPFAVTLIDSMLEAGKPEEMLKYSPRLFHNNGNGTFSDVTLAAGMHYPHGVMGANVGDVDNDGRVDVYLGTGGPDIYWLEPNTLLWNDGGRRFVNLSRFTGLWYVGKGHGLTFADDDQDGDLDVFAPEGGFEMGDLWPCVYWRNELGNRNHWLEVELIGTKSNRMGIGAKLTVRAGALLNFQEMKGGGGFGSCNGTPLHVGLGANTTADSLEIEWPSGAKSSFRDVAADQRVRVVEGESGFTRLEKTHR